MTVRPFNAGIFGPRTHFSHEPTAEILIVLPMTSPGQTTTERSSECTAAQQQVRTNAGVIAVEIGECEVQWGLCIPADHCAADDRKLALKLFAKTSDVGGRRCSLRSNSHGATGARRLHASARRQRRDDRGEAGCEEAGFPRVRARERTNRAQGRPRAQPWHEQRGPRPPQADSRCALPGCNAACRESNVHPLFIGARGTGPEKGAGKRGRRQHSVTKKAEAQRREAHGLPFKRGGVTVTVAAWIKASRAAGFTSVTQQNWNCWKNSSKKRLILGQKFSRAWLKQRKNSSRIR